MIDFNGSARAAVDEVKPTVLDELWPPISCRARMNPTTPINMMAVVILNDFARTRC